MKTIEKIVISKTSPKTNNVLWINNKENESSLNYFSNKGWENLGGSSNTQDNPSSVQRMVVIYDSTNDDEYYTKSFEFNYGDTWGKIVEKYPEFFGNSGGFIRDPNSGLGGSSLIDYTPKNAGYTYHPVSATDYVLPISYYS